MRERTAHEHTRGKGSCSACGGVLPKCTGCGKPSVHRVDGEFVCEHGCLKADRIQAAWKAEMKEALQQFERQEAARR